MKIYDVVVFIAMWPTFLKKILEFELSPGTPLKVHNLFVRWLLSEESVETKGRSEFDITEFDITESDITNLI